MSRVLVVQHTLHVDPRTGALVPKFDLSSAAEHGEVVHLLKPGAKPADPSVLQELREKLESYDHHSDALLLIGSPALIGAACAIAARSSGSGRVTVLQWGRGRYQRIAMELW